MEIRREKPREWSLSRDGIWLRWVSVRQPRVSSGQQSPRWLCEREEQAEETELPQGLKQVSKLEFIWIQPGHAFIYSIHLSPSDFTLGPFTHYNWPTFVPWKSCQLAITAARINLIGCDDKCHSSELTWFLIGLFCLFVCCCHLGYSFVKSSPWVLDLSWESSRVYLCPTTALQRFASAKYASGLFSSGGNNPRSSSPSFGDPLHPVVDSTWSRCQRSDDPWLAFSHFYTVSL